jgi:hypothetical protein
MRNAELGFRMANNHTISRFRQPHHHQPLHETRLTTNPGPNGEYDDAAAPRYNKGKTMLAFVSTKNSVNRKVNIFFLDVAT